MFLMCFSVKNNKVKGIYEHANGARID